MKAIKLLAVTALAAIPIAIPTAVANADIPDSYTVTVSPTSALPGDKVSLTATDSASEPGPDCGGDSYTATLSYTKVGGGEGSADIASGTTDSDDASISTSFTVPSDAASTDASGSTGSVSVAVDCGGGQKPPEIRRSHAAPSVVVPSASAALTIAAYSGSIKASPTFGFRGTKVDVTLENCKGGPISATFLSYGHDSTDIDVSSYDAGAATASGSFAVADDATYGPGDISGSCWQTSYSSRSFTVNDEEEEVYPVGSNTGNTGNGGTAQPVHAVKATPDFTG